MRYVTMICLFCTACLYADKTEIKEEQMTISLEDPVYNDGVLTCDKGVLIDAPGLKIQAKKIEYIRKMTMEGPVHRLVASGDLLVEFDDRFYVGDRIEYDFIEKTGFVSQGVTCIDRVFIGGEKLLFHPDKTLTIQNLYATTSVNKNYFWNVQAKTGTLDQKSVLKTEDVTLRTKDVPVFYVPTFTTKFKHTENSPFRYNVYWETGQGPMISARARLYSNDALQMYGRVDYRLQRGFATAFETLFDDPNRTQTFKARNFYAYDTFYNDNNPKLMASRYRLQGVYDATSKDESTEMFVRWDRLSDRNMQGDFTFQNFELNTLMRTEAWVRRKDDFYNASLYARPRINSYQGFMQELPTMNVRFRPFALGETGLIMSNHIMGSFLDYVYSDNIDHLLSNFRSGRVQLESDFSRPIHLPFVTLTPNIGVNSIFYSQLTNQQAGMQVIGTYGGKASSSWAKNFTNFQHLMSPYLEYTGLTAPTLQVGTAPIFSTADGLNKLNELKFGFSNALFSMSDAAADPRFGVDLYGLTFFGAPTFTTPVPKGGVHCQMNFPRVALDSQLGWNFQESVVDFANFVTKWTVNRYYAFSVEMRHRGPYYWKKDHQDNYILDVTRPIAQLANSTLSDNRNTILGRMQVQITPQCWCQLEHHRGWARANQPSYSETKLDLFAVIAAMWELKLSFMHTVRADEFSFGFSMIPGK